MATIKDWDESDIVAFGMLQAFLSADYIGRVQPPRIADLGYRTEIPDCGEDGCYQTHLFIEINGRRFTVVFVPESETVKDLAELLKELT